MSIKQKFINAMATHPMLVTFAIGLAITISIAAAGMVEVQQAHAAIPRCKPHPCW